MKLKLLRQIITMSKFSLYGLFLQCLFASLFLANASNGQSVSLDKIYVSLPSNQQQVKVTIKELQAQTAFEFVYLNNLFEYENRVIGYGNRYNSVGNILRDISKETGLHFKRVNDKIYIRKGEFKERLEEEYEKTDLAQFKVTGTVTSGEDGEPLPGVSILIKGTTTGTTTDFDGNYTLNATTDAILKYSYIGFLSQEVAINNQSEINIALSPDLEQLEEVVVVGYATQKKETLTGSVSNVQGDDLKNIPVTNVSQGLAGRLPGVVAVSGTGEPGYDGVSILIRGVNTFGNTAPLIVVDGVPGRSLDRIDPSTIESISVLKDASAAIYGAQAANGVILITTKRGKDGKPSVNFSYNQGFARPTRLPEMTNSAEYATLLNEIDQYAGGSPRYSEEEIQKFRDGSDPWAYPNSNYFDETLKPWSAQTYGNLSINGGSENVKYFVSLSNKTQDGFYKKNATNYKQYDLRSNLDIKINKYIDFVVNAYGRMEDRNYPGRGAGEIFNKLMRAKPSIPAYWPNGLPGPGLEGGDNPVVLVTNQTGYQKDKWYTLNSDFRLNVEVPWVQGLFLNFTTSIDKAINFQKRWSTPWTVYSWDKTSVDDNGDPQLVASLTGIDDPNLAESASDHQTILTRGLINYDKSFGTSHNLKLMLGAEKILGKGNDISAFRRYFISTAIDQMFAGGQQDINNGGSAYENTRLNYFGRVNYTFKDKYLAEFVWRYQGSYIFEESSRYGFFPGGSIGYVISEEEFWKTSLSFINFAKVRASWGQTGNDAIGAFQYLSSYSLGGLSFVTDGGNVLNKTLYEGVVPNRGVTWESAVQRNIGIDLQFFDGSLALTADYFYNSRDNILATRNASVPNTAGLSLPAENIGKFENRGVDFNLSYRKTTSDFSFGASLNGVFTKNKVIFWDEPPGAPEYQQTTGYPLGSSLYYNAIGIFQDQAEIDAYPHWDGARPGDIIFEDYNNDGVIDGNDRVRETRSRTPNVTGGLNLDFAYKGFDFNVLFQGALGGVFYAGTEAGDFGNFLKSFYDNRWTVENPSTENPRTYNRTSEYWVNQPNTYWLHKTDYFRLKNIELGYTIPSAITNKVGVNNFRVYVNAFNILTYSPDMKDFDPENVQGQYAGYNYPLNKVVNCGLSVKF